MQATKHSLDSLSIKHQQTLSDQLEDEQLVKLCQSGNRSAQHTLYNRYMPQMYHTCIRYLPDQMEAEDALIEAFTKVLSKIHLFEYRGKGSLSGWIKRIVVNECLMQIRKKKMDKVDIDQLVHISDTSTSDEAIIYEQLLQLMYQLPKGYRTVFNLYVIEGYSHKEIGEKLEISENTSKSQLSKARASLMKSLKKQK